MEKFSSFARSSMLIFLFLISLVYVQAAERGPYLSNVTQHAITIAWRVKKPGVSIVEFRKVNTNRWSRITLESTKLEQSVRLTGFLPNTSYEYQIDTFDENKKLCFQGKGIFKTAVKSGMPFNFIAYGDNRTGYEIHRRLVEHMLREEDIRFIINTGDLVNSGYDMRSWDEFFEITKPLLNHIPFYPCPGNHEGDGKEYLKNFYLPGNERYYSFWYSDILFIALNTNEAFDDWSTQYKWFWRTLKNGLKKKPAYVVVFFHHPPFSDGPHGDTEEVKRYLVPLIERYKVVLVLSGHDHIYEHFLIGNTHYIVTGGGGAPLYRVNKTSRGIKAISAHHYIVFEYTGKTLRAIVKDVDGAIIDEFAIPRRSY